MKQQLQHAVGQRGDKLLKRFLFPVGQVLMARQSDVQPEGPDNEAGQRRLLRRLHLRWWHAGTTTMQRTLRAAGVPNHVLELVRQIVETCAICRTWTRPGPDTVASGRIVIGFNVEVEGDILFITLAGTKYTFIHLVDRGVRWE